MSKSGIHFIPSPGEIRISDAAYRRKEAAAEAYFDRMAADMASLPDLPQQVCTGCGRTFRGPAGASCWGCTRLTQSRSETK